MLLLRQIAIRLSRPKCSYGKYSGDKLLAASPGRVRRVRLFALEPAVPPQAEAAVVGEVSVAVARLEHDLDLQ